MLENRYFDTSGWVLHHDTLFWTADGGNNWSDITPIPLGVLRAGLRVQSVFFLDTQQGWAVISYEKREPSSTIQSFLRPKTLYQVAQTVDSGQTWSFTPLTNPQLERWIQEGAFAGLGGLFFLDSEHGWVAAGLAGNSKPGKLLATQDGGRTWNWVNGPGTVGTLLFTTNQDGWLAGGPGGQFLYATHDGCRTWEEVRLVPPPQVGETIYRYVVAAAPVFRDSQHGLLVVHYLRAEDNRPKLAVYSTEDGGRTWSPAKVLPESHEGGGSPPVAIIDSVILVPTGPNREYFALARIPLEGETPAAVLASRAGTYALAFADPSSGWVLTIDWHLLATDDGGATWKDVTPWRAPNLGHAPENTSPTLQQEEDDATTLPFGSATAEPLAPGGGGGGGGGGGAGGGPGWTHCARGS